MPDAATANLVRVAVNPEGIADVFKEFDHWVVWKAVPKADGKGLDKIPHNAKTGNRASHSDSRTWSTFDEAYEAYLRDGWDGIGFVFSSGDPFVGLDFDKCRDPETGEVDPKVIEYVRRFEERYVEASVSGCGVHLITRGKLRGGKKRGKYEIYGQERFFALTGEVLDV